MKSTIVPPELRAATELLGVRAVAEMLDCSTRHVYRLSDGGRMPPPLKLGALVRWHRQSILDWIEGGCKSVHLAGRVSRD